MLPTTLIISGTVVLIVTNLSGKQVGTKIVMQINGKSPQYLHVHNPYLCQLNTLFAIKDW